jgi:hypothetical protein
MPKRVSLKGKGAEIFFGEYGQDAASAAAPPVEEQSPAPMMNDNSILEDSKPASALASSNEGIPPSDHEAVAIPEDVEKPRRPRHSTRRTTATEVTQPAKNPNESQAMLATELVFYRDQLIEQIRKTVKVPGREVSYVRLTPEEKAQLAKMVYGFRSRGKKTTENEINRIAVNFMILDYQANGEDSLLVKVIDALLA